MESICYCLNLMRKLFFEYHITIRDEDFNLGILTMRTPEGVFEADFDA